jgi:hypothetical protein
MLAQHLICQSSPFGASSRGEMVDDQRVIARVRVGEETEVRGVLC